MKHTEHISKYCNEEEILDTLERLGKYLYDLDEELIRLKKEPSCKLKLKIN